MDKELHKHLSQLDILPTTFGTNWTKLIFCRQFAATDHLLIWDAVIAAGFTLIDCVVVAMLIAVRSLLLKGDAIDCNQLLVARYPDNVDPLFVIALAVHIQEPMRYNMPQRSPFKPAVKLPDLKSLTNGTAAKKPGKQKKAVMQSSHSEYSN